MTEIPMQGRFIPGADADKGLTGSAEELVASLGFDPDKFQATNFWKKTPDVSIHLRPTSAAYGESLSAARIEEILSFYPVPDTSLPYDDAVFFMSIADAQIGKPDGGGTEATVARVKKAVQQTIARIVRDHGRVDTIIVANLGDAIEGAVSQGGRLPNDVGVAQQIAIAQTLLFEAVCALAPYCNRLIVATVPSNHGETRRDRNTTVLDNFDITIANAAEMAVSGRAGYEHLVFRYPETDEVYVVIPHLYGNLGLAHGHVGTRNPDSFRDKYVKDARSSADHPLSTCKVIASGHFHHGRWEDTGKGWDWVQAPALESGSNWFRQIFSKDSKKGILSGYLTPDGFELGQIHQGKS